MPAPRSRRRGAAGSEGAIDGRHGPGLSGLPSLRDCVSYIIASGKPTVAHVLAQVRDRGRVAVQPRCGVGGHAEMRALLRALEAEAGPDILSLTIDSHTRLLRFTEARRALNRNPADLNGYPLVSHGWQRGRELNETVSVPLEVRHGSPDARILFDIAVASGITSFEGGGISYNLPYAKAHPLAESLRAWEAVDRRCAELTQMGVLMDRELFGTLTAVLVPPSISLAVSVLEAVLAARAGVRCLSVAYPQGGHLVQDVAALTSIPVLAERYLPGEVTVHAVLHEFMGVYPRMRGHAEDLILYGALVARLGSASKVITKTYQEAEGIPDTAANIAGLRLADRANSPLLGFISVPDEQVRVERDFILAEVDDIVGPILDQRTATVPAIVEAFEAGTLDIPFSASRYARAAVIPKRDPEGAIRYLSAGSLPLSRKNRDRNNELLRIKADSGSQLGQLMSALSADINYFPNLFGEG